MAFKPGYDAASLGLLKMDYENTDPKYVAIANKGGIVLYALKPKYFNKNDLLFLQQEFKPEKGRVEFDTSVFVGTVNIKGFTTHTEYVTETVTFAPVKLINNPWTGKNPAEYAEALKTGDINIAEQYSALGLQYGTTIEPFELNIKDLPDIDLNADAQVSVTVGTYTVTKSLVHLMDPARNAEPLVKVTPSDQTMDGFRFLYDITGTTGKGIFTTGYQHTAVVDAYKQHMLQNANKEREIEDNAQLQAGISVLNNVTDFNVMGGITSIMDAIFTWALRGAGFADMRNQFSNLGGNIINNAIGQDFDTLVSVTYPRKKRIPVSGNASTNPIYMLEPAKFAVNNPKSFIVNKTYPSITEAITAIQSEFKGQIVGGDIRPMVDYGEYTGYFKRILEMGGLNELLT